MSRYPPCMLYSGRVWWPFELSSNMLVCWDPLCFVADKDITRVPGLWWGPGVSHGSRVQGPPLGGLPWILGPLDRLGSPGWGPRVPNGSPGRPTFTRLRTLCCVFRVVSWTHLSQKFYQKSRKYKVPKTSCCFFSKIALKDPGSAEI